MGYGATALGAYGRASYDPGPPVGDAGLLRIFWQGRGSGFIVIESRV
jgi:hypothetical protein